MSETKKLVAAIENGQNLTLLAERRMGKTGTDGWDFLALDRELESQAGLRGKGRAVLNRDKVVKGRRRCFFVLAAIAIAIGG